MPQIIVLKPFAFAHRGITIEQFEPHPEREPREATQELVDHAGLVEEGYIEIVGEASAPAPAPEPAPAEPEQSPAAPEPAPAPARKTAAPRAAK